MATATLEAIRTKVRRITLSPSPSQLSNADIDEYVNTFYLYDFPEHLRLFTNLVPFKFYTATNQDVYETNSDTLTAINQLSNFKNRVVSVHPPFYIDGEPAFFSQSPAEFFGIYPQNKLIETIGIGDGATTAFSGDLSNIPVQPGSISFVSISGTANPKNLNIVSANTIGVALDTLTGDGTGSVNYLTGGYNFTYSFPPGDGKEINVHYSPYKLSRPQAVMYYANKFTVRPIPDSVYEVSFQVQRTLTDLIAGSDVPELDQWWQYLAYGASKKIFEDRSDIDSVQQLMPEFKQQERLVNRRSLVQNSNERVATIYTEGVGLGAGGFNNGYGGNSF